MAYRDFIWSESAQRDLYRLPHTDQVVVFDDLVEIMCLQNPEEDAEDYTDEVGSTFGFGISAGDREYRVGCNEVEEDVLQILSIQRIEDEQPVANDPIFRAFRRDRDSVPVVQSFLSTTIGVTPRVFSKIVAAFLLVQRGLADSEIWQSLPRHPGLFELRVIYNRIKYRIYCSQTVSNGGNTYILFDGIKKTGTQRENQAMIDRCFGWLQLVPTDLERYLVLATECNEESPVRRLDNELRQRLLDN